MMTLQDAANAKLKKAEKKKKELDKQSKTDKDR